MGDFCTSKTIRHLNSVTSLWQRLQPHYTNIVLVQLLEPPTRSRNVVHTFD